MTEPIYAFFKNSAERVQASLSEYRGNTYLNIRVHYQDSDGEWKPTKKGLTIAVDLLPELEASVRALRAVVGELSE